MILLLLLKTLSPCLFYVSYIDNIHISISNHFHPPTKKQPPTSGEDWWYRGGYGNANAIATYRSGGRSHAQMLMAEIRRSSVDLGSLSHYVRRVLAPSLGVVWDFFSGKCPLKLGLKKTNFIFQALMFSGALQSLKTNMTMEIHHLKMYCLLKMEVFQCHVRFQGL